MSTKLCTACRWYRAGVSDMGVPARCGALPADEPSPVDGSYAFMTALSARQAGQPCGPSGAMWQRGGIAGWMQRYLGTAEQRP